MLRQRLEGCGVESAWLTVSPDLAQLLSPKSKRAASGNLSAFAGGYGHARQSVPFALVAALTDRVNQHVIDSCPEPEYRACVLDGSSFSPDGSAELRKAYPPCENQHGQSHFPTIRFAVAHDLWTGVALRPEWGPMYGPEAVSEQALALKLVERMPAGAVVVADRNFGVFSVTHKILDSARACVFRLTDQRAAKILGKGVPLNADGCYPVLWKPSKDDRKTNPDLAEDACIEGRVVIRHVMKQGSAKPFRLCLFVSGTDMPDDELVKLYAKRWLIETDLRTLKHTLDMARMSARTPDTLAKEILLGVTAYNLVRALGAESAKLLNVPARSISYTRIAACAKAYAPRLAAEPDPLKRDQLGKEMLLRAGARQLATRNRPSQPRKVWARRSKFPARQASTQGEKN